MKKTNKFYFPLFFFFFSLFIHLQAAEFGGEGHNWKSIIFSLLVIGFVIAGIVTAIYLFG